MRSRNLIRAGSERSAVPSADVVPTFPVVLGISPKLRAREQSASEIRRMLRALRRCHRSKARRTLTFALAKAHHRFELGPSGVACGILGIIPGVARFCPM